jgi:predicted GNAT family N-acyltransferase
MNITFKSFKHDSPLYEESILLRNRVLIEAVGRHEDCRDFDFPDKDIYISAYLGKTLIATAIITPIEEHCAKIRQMAVDIPYHRQGVGRLLVHEFEKIAIKHRFFHLVLHARETAVPFYKALGYELYGNKFYEIDIPHFAMQKHLA